METMADDTRRLLQQVGAWDEYGSNGWPPHNGAMYSGPVTIHHATSSSSKMAEYYRPQGNASTTTSALAVAKEICQKDYELIPGFKWPKLSALDFEVAMA
jgi:hypothetical protein